MKKLFFLLSIALGSAIAINYALLNNFIGALSVIFFMLMFLTLLFAIEEKK